MTNEELRELYKNCIYCDLDAETTKELTELECKTIYFPIMDEMLRDGCTKQNLADFAEACFMDYYMTASTIINIRKRYCLERTYCDREYLDSELLKYYHRVEEYNR